MAVSIKVQPDYAVLYGIDAASLPAPAEGESFKSYMERSSLGKEEDILLVVNGVSKPLTYIFADGDDVRIYPMAASG